MRIIAKFVMGCTLLLVACHGQTGEGECPWGEMGNVGSDVIITAGNQTITVEQLGKEINDLDPYKRATMQDVGNVKKFAERAGAFRLMLQEACQKELYKNPAVQEQINNIMVKTLLKKASKHELKSKKISDEEAQKHYQENIAEYQKPELRRFSSVAIDSNKKDAQNIAKKLFDDAKQHEKVRNYFKKVALLAKDVSKPSMVKEEYYSQDELAAIISKEIAQELFALKPRGVVAKKVYDHNNTLYLFRLEGVQPERNIGFKQAKMKLKENLRDKQRDQLFSAYIDDLKKKWGYSFDESKIDKIEFQTKPKALLKK